MAISSIAVCQNRNLERNANLTDMVHSLAMHESDCNSNQLRQDSYVLPDGFVGRETMVGDKNPYHRYDSAPRTS
jgi:hypothetical protein